MQTIQTRRALIAAACALAGCIIGNGDKPSEAHLPRAPLVHRATAASCSASTTDAGAKTCGRDLDCPGIATCECAGPGSPDNQCVTGGCADDARCGNGEGGYCSPTQGTCGTRSLVTNENQTGYPHYCHTISDECLDDTDCPGTLAYCRYEAASLTWRCATQPCP